MNSIRPQDVLSRYMGANTLEEQRIACELYNNTPACVICRIARAMGYTHIESGRNSIWNQYWFESR
jgi:hypothetical protein